MENLQQENRTIAIADYRWKYILYSVVCWALVIAGFFAFRAKDRHWQFWMAEIVMLLFGSGLLYMLFNPRYKFIGRKGEEYNKWMNGKYQGLLQENGMFGYSADGFEFNATEGAVKVKWNEIIRNSAHLEDEISNDEDVVIRIDLPGDHYLEFDEEIPGWTKWEAELRNKFSGISPDWMSMVINSGKKELVLYP